MAKSFPSRSVEAFATCALALGLLAGCASPPSATDPEAVTEYQQTNDPLEPTNRAIFDFNQKLDKLAFKPVAEAYHDYVPDFARDRVHDLVDNWRAPLRLANDVAQGDADRAVETFIRFTFNTGFGIGGLFDVASAAGVPNHQTDTGATFAVWGAGEGPYLVLPVLGPSNPRDLTGIAIDYAFDPLDYSIGELEGFRWATETRGALSGLDRREKAIDALNEIDRTALDLYSSIRSLYRQHREAEIHHRPSLDKLPSPGFSSAPAAGPEISQETH